jgi:DNA-binding XRE family transcriptional regulator
MSERRHPTASAGLSFCGPGVGPGMPDEFELFERDIDKEAEGCIRVVLDEISAAIYFLQTSDPKLLETLILKLNKLRPGDKIGGLWSDVPVSLEVHRLIGELIRILKKRKKDLAAGRSVEPMKLGTARKLFLLRARANWTIDDLAEKVDIDRRTVLRHMKGGKFHQKTAVKYAEVFSEKLKEPITPEYFDRED